MIDVFRFQIATYISMVAIFAALVVLKDYAAYLKVAFVLATATYFIEIAAWAYYFSQTAFESTLKYNMLLIQNGLVVFLTTFLAFLAIVVLLQPD